MKIAATIAGLVVLAACQTTDESLCERKDYEPGTPEFDECERARREAWSRRAVDEAERRFRSTSPADR